jgi:hypothetical protein
MNAYGAYSTVAGVSALASFLLGFSIIKTLAQITDNAMWAIAAMVFAPAIMGISISFFIFLSHQLLSRREPERRQPADDGFPPGAYTARDH